MRFLYFKIIIFANIESVDITSCICNVKKGFSWKNLVKIKRLIRKIYVLCSPLDDELEQK